jgi:hypothetical protein
MPWSQVHTFTDPGEYAAAIRATTIDLTVMARGHFIGKRTRIDLHRLWMRDGIKGLDFMVREIAIFKLWSQAIQAMQRTSVTGRPNRYYDRATEPVDVFVRG